jgi:hypothetical protein
VEPTPKRATAEVYRIVATEELADVLADLKSRTVDWKGVNVEQLGRRMRYDL